MGAWGHYFDENDDAADWLAEFGDSPDWSAVDGALNSAGGDYVEAPEAACALAAAEVVAAGIGNASQRLDPEIAGWASQSSDRAEQRRGKAADVLSRVRDNSELSELWEESDEHADWKASVNETISRL